MSTITKERLEPVIERFEHYATNVKWTNVQAAQDMLIAVDAMRRLLASLEAEPVAYIRDGFRADGVHFCGGIITAEEHERTKPALSDRYTWKHQPLYTAPPVPVSVPDERYQHLSELYHAQEKRLFKLAQRVKGPSFDKYAHSPSQAIDVLESAIFGECKDEDCRAAMLQGAENAESTTTMQTAPALDSSPKIAESTSDNSPVIPDGYAEMLQRWLTFGRGMQKAGSQLPRNLIAETEAMIAAAPKQEVKP